MLLGLLDRFISFSVIYFNKMIEYFKTFNGWRWERQVSQQREGESNLEFIQRSTRQDGLSESIYEIGKKANEKLAEHDFGDPAGNMGDTLGIRLDVSPSIQTFIDEHNKDGISFLSLGFMISMHHALPGVDLSRINPYLRSKLREYVMERYSMFDISEGLLHFETHIGKSESKADLYGLSGSKKTRVISAFDEAVKYSLWYTGVHTSVLQSNFDFDRILEKHVLAQMSEQPV